MSEENTAVAPETAEIADSEVDKFFETGNEEAEAKEESVAPVVEDEKPEEKEEKQKTVPYGALHEERMRRKELQSRVDSMEGRFQQIMHAMQSQQMQNQQQPLPSAEEDPVTNFNHRISQVEQIAQNQIRAAQQAQFENAVIGAYTQRAQMFEQEAPDFKDAYKFYIDGRVGELIAMGYAPQEANHLAKQEEFGVAFRILNSGGNPAEAIYKAAQQRGYRKSEPKPAEQPKLETIERGVKASKVSGGAPTAGDVTLESLAELTDEEFDKEWDRLISGKKGKFY